MICAAAPQVRALAISTMRDSYHGSGVCAVCDALTGAWNIENAFNLRPREIGCYICKVIDVDHCANEVNGGRAMALNIYFNSLVVLE